MTETLQACSCNSRRQLLRQCLGAAALGLAGPAARAATGQGLPGRGISVLPLKSALAEETFQTLLVMKALEQLGYTVKPYEEVDYPLAHIAVANGDATLIANHWNPHHAEFYKAAGGDARLLRRGVYAAHAAQGYLIDKRTAEQHGITNLAQLKDPRLARLFDSDGDGKANLVGPNAGWGGEAVVNHQIKAFGLENTVSYIQGNYPALIAETLARFRDGKPVLYYAWTPYWLSNVLRPGQEVIWLQVPFSAMPGVQAGTSTKLPDGKNYGFPLNNQYIVANKAWARSNPAAARLFELMRLSVADINAQNYLMNQGQSKSTDIERHAAAWIKVHRKTFDGWIAQALAAAPQA